MFLELWERFRGYDHWNLTEATIESSQMEDHVYTYRGQTSHEYDSGNVLVWIDRQGNRQSGFCRVPDNSPLYQLIDGEKIAIRYNPNNPGEYYLPEVLKARLSRNLLQVAAVALLLSCIVAGAIVFARVFK